MNQGNFPGFSGFNSMKCGNPVNKLKFDYRYMYYLFKITKQPQTQLEAIQY